MGESRPRGRILPALVSLLFPGFGHALAGRRTAAIVWCVVAALVPLLAFVWMAFACLPLLVHVAAGIAAYVALRKPLAAAPSRPLAAIVVVIASICAGMFALEASAYRIPASSMYPTLEIGDHILAEKLSLLWRAPSRGEVIVFAMPCEPSREYIKRIVGVPGDRIEMRCNVLYVNGTAIPATLVDASCRYDDFNETMNEWSPKTCSRYHEVLDGIDYDIFDDVDRPARTAQLEAKHTLDGTDLRFPTEKDFPRLDRPHFPSSCTHDPGLDNINPAAANQPEGKIVETKHDAGLCEQQLHYVVPDGSLFVLGDNRSNSNDSRYWGVVPMENIHGRARGIWLGGSGQRLSRLGSIR